MILASAPTASERTLMHLLLIVALLTWDVPAPVFGIWSARSRGAAGLSSVQERGLPLIAVVATGGTIAGRAQGRSLTAQELVDGAPGVRKIARLWVEDVSHVGSPDMTPAVWLKLAERINELVARSDVAGVVVTHGTDTLEETAYFLDLTVRGEKPVVVVGAQRPPSEPDSDGPRNLLNAARVAVSSEAAGKGVMVVMNGQIHAARDVSKTNTTEVEAFKTLEFGQLGYVDREAVRFYRAPLRRQTIALDGAATLGRVEIVSHYAGADGRVIKGLVEQGPLDGLVIAGTGVGNVSQVMYEVIKQEVRGRGIPVIITTRVQTGRVMADKGRRIALQDIGCVFADNLTPPKARVLLLVALTQTKNSEELRRYFER